MFIAYKALVENKFQAKIGTLFSDNGGEYIALRSFLAEHVISHLTSPPHTPQHSGVSERKHRHIVETGLTLLSTSSMPKEYWTYAFTAAVYLINRLLSPTISMQSPYQKLFGEPPNYEKLRVFGCKCFPWLRPYTKHKLQPRSTECVFLGYSPTQSAYYCLDTTTGRVYTSRHVQFVETEFPFNKETKVPDDKSSPSSSYTPPATTIPTERMGPSGTDLHPQPPTTQVLPSTPQSLSSSTSEPTAHSQNESQPMTQQSPTLPEPTAPTQNETTPTSQSVPTTNHLPPSPAMPVQPTEPEIPVQEQPQNIHKMQIRAKNKITKPIQKLTLTVAGKKHRAA